MTIIDRLGKSTGRLALVFVAALALTVCGSIGWIGGHLVGGIASFIGGAIFAVALTSWQINASERTQLSAMRSYWKTFSTDSVIVLSVRSPEEMGDDNEFSPFTPYHDALGGQQVQRFLLEKFGRQIPIKSAADFAGLHEVDQKNLILIGGPNHNHLTDQVMGLVWAEQGGRYFNWSSTFSKDAVTESLVKNPEDHLLKVDSSRSALVADDSIDDVHDVDGDLIKVRGMAFRVKGLYRAGQVILVLAGVDTSFGTLAATEYTLAPGNLVDLTGGDSQVIVGANPYGQILDTPTSLRVIHGDA